MAVRLYRQDLSEILLERNFPMDFLHQGEGVSERHTELTHCFGDASYQEIFFEGVHIGFGHASLREQVQLGFEAELETVEMHFSLKGQTAAITDQFQQAIGFQAHQHNILYANKLKGTMHWNSHEFKLCEINLHPGFFKKFLPQTGLLFEHFRRSMEEGRSGILSPRHPLIQANMYPLIEDIMHCDRQGAFKRMFLEAKVIELLMLQLEQLSDVPLTTSSLKKNDLEKVYAVRELIIANPDKPATLVNLALGVGTNEYTLKKGFKELFGTTVFGFWNDLKLEQARLMLLDSGMNVGEVSDKTGYKNARHFSTAFKKKFGVLPSQLHRHHSFHS